MTSTISIYIYLQGNKSNLAFTNLRPKKSKDHHLNQLGRPHIPDAIYQDSVSMLV